MLSQAILVIIYLLYGVRATLNEMYLKTNIGQMLKCLFVNGYKYNAD